jgi:hypothetical protein
VEACELGEAIPKARAAGEDLAPLIESIAEFQTAAARLAVQLHQLRPATWQSIATEIRANEHERKQEPAAAL